MIILSILLIPIYTTLELRTSELWGIYYRPEWASEVIINYDNNINSIEGILLPLNTDSRPDYNPDPYNNCPVGIINNNDRGHIMALSNGGPNIIENIVPQYNIWQRYGKWRLLEKQINTLLLKEYKLKTNLLIDNISNFNPKNTVYWKINLIYSNYYDCQPIMYKGFIKTKTHKYKFKIINNSTDDYKWEKTKRNDLNINIKFIIIVILVVGTGIAAIYVVITFIIENFEYNTIEEESGIECDSY